MTSVSGSPWNVRVIRTSPCTKLNRMIRAWLACDAGAYAVAMSDPNANPKISMRRLMRERNLIPERIHEVDEVMVHP
ncbi:MAG: hypothetical protein NVS9B4_22080 [Candidatus Acidiferrum sp.]